VLKLQLRAVPGPEAAHDTTGLVLFYHPELRSDDFELPPADPQGIHIVQERNQETLPDVLSRRTVAIISGQIRPKLGCFGDVLSLSIEEDSRLFAYLEREMVRAKVPTVSDNPRDALLYVLKSVVKLSVIRPGLGSNALMGNVRRIEVRISKAVATDAFEIKPPEYTDVGSGWVCVASREVYQ
jgi:hypothetical protein